MFLNNYRFRKYFIRVLMFIPRLMCGKNLGRNWENRKTNHTMELRHVNGVGHSQYVNSQISNSHTVMAHSHGYTSRFAPNSPSIARSKSMLGTSSENQTRDTAYGNSLLPYKNSRLTASCVSTSQKYCKTRFVRSIKSIIT